MTLTTEAISLAVSHYFWPFLRLLALLHVAPLFSEKGIDRKTKIGLALVIPLLLAGQLPPQEIAIFSYEGLWMGLKQLLIGTAMGLSMQFIFAAVRMAGELIAAQMGLSFATFYDPSSGGSLSVISRLLNMLVLLLFLAADGHLWLLQMLYHSFAQLPLNASPLSGQVFLWLCHSAGVIFTSSLMLSLPVIILLLCINLTLGVLNRLTPQLSVFVIGFPLTLTLGMLTLCLTFYTLAPFFDGMMGSAFERLQILIPGLHP